MNPADRAAGAAPIRGCSISASWASRTERGRSRDRARRRSPARDEIATKLHLAAQPLGKRLDLLVQAGLPVGLVSPALIVDLVKLYPDIVLILPDTHVEAPISRRSRSCAFLSCRRPSMFSWRDNKAS